MYVARNEHNKKVKTNVERESIFIIKRSHQTWPQFQKKISSVMTNCKDWINNYKNFVKIYK